MSDTPPLTMPRERWREVHRSMKNVEGMLLRTEFSYTTLGDLLEDIRNNSLPGSENYWGMSLHEWLLDDAKGWGHILHRDGGVMLDPVSQRLNGFFFREIGGSESGNACSWQDVHLAGLSLEERAEIFDARKREHGPLSEPMTYDEYVEKYLEIDMMTIDGSVGNVRQTRDDISGSWLG